MTGVLTECKTCRERCFLTLNSKKQSQIIDEGHALKVQGMSPLSKGKGGILGVKISR